MQKRLVIGRLYWPLFREFSDGTVSGMRQEIQSEFTRRTPASELFRRAGIAVQDQNLLDGIDITGVTDDSRAVCSDACFVAVRGSDTDGHRFVADAVRAGARVIVSEDPVELSRDVCGIRVKDTRSAIARLVAAYYRLDSRSSTAPILSGITGTNGKTTVAWLIRAILRAAGHKTAMFGTVEYDLISEKVSASLTTPGPVALCQHLFRAQQAGATHAVMEVSSHALDQQRCDGLTFRVGVFTNLTGDHLDYHGSMENYAKAKRRLFGLLDANGVAVVNADDPYGLFMVGGASRSERRVAIGRIALDNFSIPPINQNLELPLPDGRGTDTTAHRAVAHGPIALDNFSILPINQNLELPLPDGRGTETTAQRAVAYGECRVDDPTYAPDGRGTEITAHRAVAHGDTQSTQDRTWSRERDHATQPEPLPSCGLAVPPTGVITYGLETAGVDVRAESYQADRQWTRFEMVGPWGRMPIRSSLVGKHNVLNMLAASGAAWALGVSAEDIQAGIQSVSGVPGRLQRVEPDGSPFSVLVDYAHTDDALKNVLTAIRPLTPGRVICVFGCGGDRDRTKRPRMARVVGELADVAIVTSDNPRSENPKAIIDEILAGFGEVTRCQVMSQVDRRTAICLAVQEARYGDTVLIAGKGHENYQLVGKQTLHFDDVEVARESLAELKCK